jgi:tetratricopeptide (TPR) repeat protein
MARALRDDRLTPADELRSLLAECEKLLVNLRGSGSNALDLLQNMDRIAGLIPELEASGADLRAERSRWDALQSAVRTNASRIVRQASARGGLAELRHQSHPDGQAAWWWRLDQEVAARSRKRLLRFGLIALALVAAVVAAGQLVKLLFPVDPKVQEATGKLMEGQSKLQYDGDYRGALPLFQEAVTLTPEDAEAWLWLGATQQRLGDAAAASESFRRSAALIPDPLDLRTRRAIVYLALGMLDEGAADADSVLASDPENPQAHMILAGISDARGQYTAAVEALQRAAEFADKRNQPQISATARYQMGMLLQRMPIGPPPSVTPTPP